MRFLFVDQIVQSSPGKFVRGIKHITKEDSCLTRDEQGLPCFISSLIGETLGQLAAWNVMAHYEFTLRPVAGVVASARLCRPAYVGETLLLESFIDALDESAVQYHSIARVGEHPVFIIEGALGPLLPMNDFIEQREVRGQYQEIYRPADWPMICDMAREYTADELIDTQGTHSSFFTFDKIIARVSGESITAEKRITRAAPYFPDHFPKKPVLPMTVLLECIQNLARQFVVSYSQPYQIAELRKIKMNEFVQPGDVLVCHMKVKQQNNDIIVLACRSEVNGKRVCVVEVVLTTQC